MSNETSTPSDYAVAREARKMDRPLPASNGSTVTPKYLLNHENHFDPNTHTPEEMIKRGVHKGQDELKQT
jgi:hypothetical protein